MLAAAPPWFAENLREISAGTLLLLTFVVIRLVQKAMMRTVLLALIAAAAVVVYLNRAPLTACVQTCECELAGRHVTVPTCGSNLSR